jgi:hypothetical protein
MVCHSPSNFLYCKVDKDGVICMLCCAAVCFWF